MTSTCASDNNPSPFKTSQDVRKVAARREQTNDSPSSTLENAFRTVRPSSNASEYASFRFADRR